MMNAIRRRSRLAKFEGMMTMLEPGPGDSLLEVGIANRERSEVDNFVIKRYPYPGNITALGYGDIAAFRERYPHIRVTSYDGRLFPFRDGEFDVAHSNAVIEHVGPLDRQALFLAEMKRVAKRGMITTPNLYFPVETHTKLPFIHWLGKRTFDSIVTRLGKGWASGDYMHLLGRRELVMLARMTGLGRYNVISNRFFGLTMTYSLVWSNG